MTSKLPMTVLARRVFRPWDYAGFVVLTLLSWAAISYCYAGWIAAGEWRQAPLAFVGTVTLLTALVALQQARWWLLPMMKRPVPIKMRRNWRVAVATTFVPDSEPLDMLEAMLKALVALDYPHDTWVLDEGDDECVRELCDKYDVRHFTRRGDARYQTPSGVFRERTKYGNYNSWLSEEGFENYDVVAAFDPDHIPERRFLTSVLGYFEDPQVAYVQAAQAYGNQGESWIARGAAEETYDYFSTIQMASYGLRFPIIVGGHNTHRVAALQQIGGLAAHDADDTVTTLRYRDAGWQGVYLPRILARGRTPSDWHAYFTQQRRWARSVLDIKLRTCPSLSDKTPLITRLLSLVHGFNYLAQGLLPVVALAVFCAICLTRSSSYFVAREFIIPLCVLSAAFAVCELFRQRFFLDPHCECGLHWRASVLRWAKWPQVLLALWDVALDRRLPYVVTAKAKSTVQATTWLWPHLLAAALVVCCWLVGVGGGTATALSHVIVASICAGTIGLVIAATYASGFRGPRTHTSEEDFMSRKPVVHRLPVAPIQEIR